MCSVDNCSRPSINKKYDLCDLHNYERLHGRSKQEVYKERASKKIKKIYFLKQNKPINKITKKEAVRKAQLSAVKLNIELEAVQNNEYYCQGCGRSYVGLDKSHILSVGSRKDLELEKDNINLLCRSCHMNWESGDIAKMVSLNCFERDLNYILNHDVNFYEVIINKIKHYLRWNEDLETEKVEKMKNILKKYQKKVASSENR